MRKYCCCVLGVLTLVMLVLTIRTCLNAQEKKQESAEIAAFAADILEIRKLMQESAESTGPSRMTESSETSEPSEFQTAAEEERPEQETRFPCSVSRAESCLKALGERISRNPSASVRLTVMPEYAELLQISGQKTAAKEILERGMSLVQECPDEKVQTVLYIGFAEICVHCGEYEKYREYAGAAAETAGKSGDAKWRSDMQKTLGSLHLLAAETFELRTFPEIQDTENKNHSLQGNR